MRVTEFLDYGARYRQPNIDFQPRPAHFAESFLKTRLMPLHSDFGYVSVKVYFRRPKFVNAILFSGVALISTRLSLPVTGVPRWY